MNRQPVVPAVWRPQKWWGLAVLILAAQLGIIFWLSGPEPARPRSSAPAPALRLVGTAMTEMLRLQDPTLFALPHRQGFAGLAWLEGQPHNLDPFDWFEPPIWLPLPVERLGLHFSLFCLTNRLEAPTTWQEPAPELPLPQVAPAEAFPVHSTVQVRGELANRPLLTPFALRSWYDTNLLSPTRLEVLVDAQGRTLSVTVPSQASRSGHDAADQFALEQARAARFQPLVLTGPDRVENPLTGLTWGEIIFTWQTLPPTNRPNIQ